VGIRLRGGGRKEKETETGSQSLRGKNASWGSYKKTGVSKMTVSTTSRRVAKIPQSQDGDELVGHVGLRETSKGKDNEEFTREGVDRRRVWRLISH